MSILPEMPEIAAAIDEESARWLDENLPELYAGVAAAVNRDCSPDEVYRYVLRLTNGRNSGALADRCKQTARHLQRVKE